MTGIERGTIREKDEHLYRVESATRTGAVTRWIGAIGEGVQETEYSVGDGVYFFMFDDGRGMILGRMED